MPKRLFYWLAVCAGLLFITAPARAQAPAWQMAMGFDPNLYIELTANDATGNVYLAGTFISRATLGSTTLVSRGQSDVFVAKWHPSNGFLWVQAFGGTGMDIANALEVSGSSVYVAGDSGSPTLLIGTTTLTNHGGTDVFVAKLTDAGSTATWTWAQMAGSTSNDLTSGMAVQDNNLYVTGISHPGISFGTTTLSSDACFVAKLADGGAAASWAWAQAASGAVGSNALAVSDSSIYVAGNFFGNTAGFGTIQLAGNGASDAYLAKLTDRGGTASWTWAQAAGSTDNDNCYALAANGHSVYVVGRFEGTTINFGPTTLTTLGVTSYDAFVAKLTDAGSAGTWTWASVLDASAVAVAAHGSSVYVAGGFSDSLTLGPTTFISNGRSDAFVAKLADAGSTSAWMWAQSIGGANSESVETLTLGGNSLYLAGLFYSPTMQVGSTTLLNASVPGISYLAALTDPALSTPDEVGAPTFTLSPNPARATAALSGAAPGSRCTLLDGLGRTVLTTNADASGAALLDVRALPAGLYLVRTEGKAGARRLVVE